MTDLSNEELREKIKKYERILEGRSKNDITFDINKVLGECCTNIKFKNVDILLNTEEQINDVVITYFYYNNLTIEDIMTTVEHNLYLLYTKIWRIQCESDSSYEESEYSEDEVSVTKIKNICYMTKADLNLFLNSLLQRT